MGQVLRFIASAIVLFLFMLSLVFSFDSSDTLTNIKLVSVNILFWGALLWLINRKSNKQ